MKYLGEWNDIYQLLSDDSAKIEEKNELMRERESKCGKMLPIVKPM